jgi:hypothetical protein
MQIHLFIQTARASIYGQGQKHSNMLIVHQVFWELTCRFILQS